MCDFQWTALAEFNFHNKNIPNEIYCLCSRVFTWTYGVDEAIGHISHNHINEDDGTFSKKNLHEDQSIAIETLSSGKSSSITDPDLHGELCSLLESNKAVIELKGHDFVSNDAMWHDYWTLNGERLIWESWIAKYSAYINPQYAQAFYEPTAAGNYSKESSFDKPESASSLKLSFDSLSPRQDSSDYSITLECSINQPVKDLDKEKTIPSNEVVEKNRMLVRNLSGSESYDKINTEGEGWNPLSPISNTYETEIERLISSRCGSRTGSSSRTFDSMTNVTHMTVSSIDLSESSKSSDSFSSLSSVQSSLTSSSSDDLEDTPNHEQQWNELWAHHYEQEYLQHYKKFGLQNIDIKNISDLSSKPVNHCNPKDNFGIGSEFSDKETFSTAVLSNDLATRTAKEVLKIDKINGDATLLSSILNLMKMDELDNSVDADLPTCLDDGTVNPNTERNSEENKFEHCMSDEKQMNILGLPAAFCTKQDFKKSASVKKLKMSKRDQSNRDRIKSAFNLIGMQLNEGNDEKLFGSFNYQMPNIARQNDSLKMCKHVRFDDDGFAVPEPQVTVQNSHQDELLGIIPSSSAEDDADEFKSSKNNPGALENRKKRKRRDKPNLPVEIKENPILRKYWHRRYSLFSKFDEGIQLDKESWFSVTPELIAKNTAQRLKCDLVIDAFCGAGGNAIQLAQTCNKVIAIDIDVNKIKLAQHNAEVYKVADRIEFIVGDFFQLAESLKGDVVFLSPPWGGPQYLSKPIYDLNLLQPQPFTTLFSTANKISPNICIFLPRNCNTYPLITAAGPGRQVELEQNFLNKKLIALSAYYGNLKKNIL